MLGGGEDAEKQVIASPRSLNFIQVSGFAQDAAYSPCFSNKSIYTNLPRAPHSVLALAEIDTPLTPMSMENVWKGVEHAQEVFDKGDRVMVYCKGGIHPSVAMACCILISQGYSAEDAISLVKERRPVADPYTDHFKTCILKFEEEWKTQNDG